MSQGLVINVVFDSSVAEAPSGFTVAFNDAVQFYESSYSDPITINLHVGWGEIGGSPLSSGALGQSETFLQGFFSYAETRTALTSDARSVADSAAVASLGAVDPTGGGSFLMANAEAKALGLLAANDPGIDGYVGFAALGNSYTFDPNSRAVVGKYDFIGIAEHEIAEVMGRFADLGQFYGSYTPLDLFRYSAPGGRSLVSASGAYFSIDSGSTSINTFNGPGGGDIGDWAGVTLDAFNASTGAGQRQAVSAGDVTEMDVLGYDRILPAVLAVMPSGLTLSSASDSGVKGDNITNVTTPLIKGTGEAGDTVALFDGSTQIGLGTVDGSGNWSVTASTLTAGSHALTATATNGAGTSAPSAPLTIMIDTAPPVTKSTSLTVNGNSPATAIGIASPTDSDFAISALSVSVTALPTDGTVLMPDGITAVAQSAALSITQLTGLLFKPAANAGGQISGFTYTVSDPAGNTATGTATLAVQDTAASDFNGDGKSDILFQNINGTVAIWEMNGFNVMAMQGGYGVDPSFHAIGTGDFNGDGKSDILFQNTNGTVAIWEMNGFNVMAMQSYGGVDPSYHAIGTGDFFGTGKSDILFQNISGEVAIWEMNGLNVVATQGAYGVDPSFHAIGSGDFNGDGKSDILYQNVSGEVAIWEMNGFDVTAQQGGYGVDPSWHAIGTGDFNADGKSDILYQNASGEVAIWEMNGFDVTAQQGGYGVDPSWHAIGTGDFNADGKSDILYQNISGEVAIWEMNGFNVIGMQGGYGVDPSFHVIMPTWHAAKLLVSDLVI